MFNDVWIETDDTAYLDFVQNGDNHFRAPVDARHFL